MNREAAAASASAEEGSAAAPRQLRPAAALRSLAATESGERMTAQAMRYAAIGRAFVVAYCAAVFLVALGATVLTLQLAPVQRTADASQVVALGVLAALALVVTRLFDHRGRQTPAATSWDVHSVWLLGSALVLPFRVTLGLTLALLVHSLVIRRATPARAALYWGSSVLGVLAARAVAGWQEPDLTAVTVLGAALAMVAVQGGAVLALARMTHVPRSWRAVLGEPAGLLAEVTALSVGALLAVGLGVDVWFALLAVAPMLLIVGSFQLPILRRSAEQDAKTGLQSTVHWQHQAAERLLHAQQRRRPAAVVLIDVDRFKLVNDSVGHLAGDAVLLAVARAAEAQLRSGDVIGRFGGDEIVALLSDATADQATVVGDRMRTAVSDIAVSTRGVDGAPLTVDGLTVSVGVAASDNCGYELSELLLAADGALLQAKRTGRNRVCTA